MFDKASRQSLLDGDQIPYGSVTALLDPLWSAGFVVLFAAGNIPVETRRTLETTRWGLLFLILLTAEPSLNARRTGESHSCASGVFAAQSTLIDFRKGGLT